MWPADFRHGDDVWREKRSFLFFDGRASSSLTGNTSKRNYYYIHTYSLLYSITCLPYLVVTALQSNFIVRISDSKKTHNNCQHKAPRATLQQGPATQNSTQSTADTYQFIKDVGWHKADAGPVVLNKQLVSKFLEVRSLRILMLQKDFKHRQMADLIQRSSAIKIPFRIFHV